MKKFHTIIVMLLLICFSIQGLQVNQENNVLRASQSSLSIEASNLSGAEWPWAYGCSCSFDDIVEGDDGYLYVTGTFIDNMTLAEHTLTSQGSYDIFIGKVHPNGEWDWVVQAGGEGNDQGRFIAKTGQTNIVVYGFFQGTATFGSIQHTSTSDSGPGIGSASNQDLFISLLDEDGVWQWTRTAGGSNGYGDRPGGLAVDSQSNIYISGSFVGDITLGSFSFVGEGNYDGFVAKLTPGGAWVFANHIGGNYNQVPMQLSIHDDVGVIVYGSYAEQAIFDSINLSTDGHIDVFVAKMRLSGVWEWVSSAGGPSSDFASALDVDSSGNILVAGKFRGYATFGNHSLESPFYMEYEVFLAKLTPDGEWTWSLMIDKAPDTDLIVRDIEFNPKDDILIAGEFEEFLDLNIVNLTAENRDDLFFASLGQDGQWHWGVSYGGNGWDSADLVSIDEAANIYIGGSYDNSIQIEDHLLNQTNVDGDGSFVGFFQLDTDNDGYNDGVDDLPNDPGEWSDSDSDGVGDNEDSFPADPSEWLDTDGDGVGNNQDAFPSDSTESLDTDGDRIGDNADTDDDNDGVPDLSDDFPNDANETTDTDGDGIGDNNDDDDDGDGFLDEDDDCPYLSGIFAESELGCPDSDDDGVIDLNDLCPDTIFYKETVNEFGCALDEIDSDEDGIKDIWDLCEGHPDEVDIDENGIPDGCDDSDGDGIIDSLDICPDGDDNYDSNQDGTPDACEITNPEPDNETNITAEDDKEISDNTSSESIVVIWIQLSVLAIISIIICSVFVIRRKKKKIHIDLQNDPVEVYTRNMVELGYDENAARQYAEQYYATYYSQHKE